MSSPPANPALHDGHASSSLGDARAGPPPLPPRAPSSSNIAPPPYSEFEMEGQKGLGVISEQWRSTDPRASSMHSLVPSESQRAGRRTLLLIFIHGFMGNETSFQSFPAHVHNLVSMTMAETHVVHTKIYPRYKSRKAIEFARDDFSSWSVLRLFTVHLRCPTNSYFRLEPHEDPQTDVILLGHSMGGILGVEVALLPPSTPVSGPPFRHRILGTINFDTPFLGMHPGLVGSGISSLFRPAPEMPQPAIQQGSFSPGSLNPSASQSQVSMSTEPWSDNSSISGQISSTSGSMSSTSTLTSNDPYYDPPFPNDIRLTQRSGWNNLVHFINKHADGQSLATKFENLASSTKQYFVSHLEFGGCLADFPGLRNRYNKVRGLEEVDDISSFSNGQPNLSVRRIRFINYYTASTGIPKKTKPAPEQPVGEDSHLEPSNTGINDKNREHSRSRSVTPTPSISVDVHDTGAITPQTLEDGPDASPIEAQIKNLGEASGVKSDQDDLDELPPMQHIDSMPVEDDWEPRAATPEPTSEIEPTSSAIQNTEPSSSSPAAATLVAKMTEPQLPPIPDLPNEPASLDLTLFTDKDSRKLAEKDHKRLQKAYQTAVKDRENALNDRRKLVEKREKKARQEAEKAAKSEAKQRLKDEKDEDKRRATINPEPLVEREVEVDVITRDGHRGKETVAVREKPKKDRKFCLLPTGPDGKRDSCWVRVYMEGVDEVGAHCGLFFQGPQYESLVGDVGDRIQVWVVEDMTRRAILEGP
jgi:pimeloyl-ACP methyl ester carboxylesterase